MVTGSHVHQVGNRVYYQISRPRSWKEASKMRRAAAGFLPMFKSREELDEFVALIVKR